MVGCTTLSVSAVILSVGACVSVGINQCLNLTYDKWKSDWERAERETKKLIYPITEASKLKTFVFENGGPNEYCYRYYNFPQAGIAEAYECVKSYWDSVKEAEERKVLPPSWWTNYKRSLAAEFLKWEFFKLAIYVRYHKDRLMEAKIIKGFLDTRGAMNDDHRYDGELFSERELAEYLERKAPTEPVMTEHAVQKVVRKCFMEPPTPAAASA